MQMITGLERAGLNGASLLEIGCGVGYLHQSLLELGAGEAVGIELSERMLEEAKALSKKRELSERVQYLQGDFVVLADQLSQADVTILDKVICCYPDAEGMVSRSLDKTGRVYALTIPRDRWYTRMGVRLAAVFLWLIRSSFRSFVYDPHRIEDWITERGYRKVYENVTPIWLTQVYARQAQQGPGV